MRRAFVVLGCVLAAAPALAAEAGRVACCVELAIPGVVEVPRCLRVNFNVTPRRLAKRPKRFCRAVGGTPASTIGLCTCSS
ncbi:MAG: hypothetical protein U0807_08240 [Candidatus Binatia bacterium]